MICSIEEVDIIYNATRCNKLFSYLILYHNTKNDAEVEIATATANTNKHWIPLMKRYDFLEDENLHRFLVIMDARKKCISVKEKNRGAY